MSELGGSTKEATTARHSKTAFFMAIGQPNKPPPTCRMELPDVPTGNIALQDPAHHLAQIYGADLEISPVHILCVQELGWFLEYCLVMLKVLGRLSSIQETTVPKGSSRAVTILALSKICHQAAHSSSPNSAGSCEVCFRPSDLGLNNKLTHI